MSVSVVIPTRGDVDLKPILQSFPEEWDVVVYDNGRGGVFKRVAGNLLARIVTGKGELPDLSVYARYAAIEYADNDLILTQDDDCIVNDPKAIVERWTLEALPDRFMETPHTNHVVCNMPANFRHSFYEEHALVGFGAAFHRAAPERAFARFGNATLDHDWPHDFFARTCDIVFTGLTPRVLVDVPKTNLWWAEDSSRMWRQPSHVEERTRMLELVKAVRDAA